jgi:hypothetical protein
MFPTHVPLGDPSRALPLPVAVKRHLGLDEAPSWFILDEVNEFMWPGFDVHPIPPSRDRFAYGFLPPRLFDRLMARLKELWAARHGRATPRDCALQGSARPRHSARPGASGPHGPKPPQNPSTIPVDNSVDIAWIGPASHSE